ncbi:MAG TPA: transposase [Bryobacteraceae bacterium]|nr:transposase [Bryobacteraceae bacterium]
MAVRHLAVARKLTAGPIPTPGQALSRKSICLDGPLFGHRPRGADVSSEPGSCSRSDRSAQARRGNGFYKLRAFVVMANHVHVLLYPHKEASYGLQWIKGVTAREANQLLARTGKAFWQRESYDHWVRDSEQLERIVAYIERNPVKAGLSACVDQYPWSSAWKSGQ